MPVNCVPPPKKEKNAHFKINKTLKLIQINGVRTQSFVCLCQLHLCWKFYKATSKIVNYAMNYVKGIKSVFGKQIQY